MHSSRATLHCVDIVFGHPQLNNDPTNAKNEDTVFMGRCIAVSVILWEQPIDHASSSFLSFLNATRAPFSGALFAVVWNLSCHCRYARFVIFTIIYYLYGKLGLMDHGPVSGWVVKCFVPYLRWERGHIDEPSLNRSSRSIIIILKTYVVRIVRKRSRVGE